MRRVLSILLIILAPSLTGGCGSSRAPQGNEYEAAVDADHSTPEGVLAAFNRLMNDEPGNALALVECYFAETDLQRRLLRHDRMAAALFDLDWIMRDRFGEAFDPAINDAWQIWPDRSPARVVRIEGDRATARRIDHKRRTRDLHLVKVGERWWISGYTLEHELPREGITAPDLDRFERWLERVSPVAESVAARIRAGEITSASEARRLVRAAADQS